MNWWNLKKYRRRFLLGAVYGFGFYLVSTPGTELSTWATHHFVRSFIAIVSDSGKAGRNSTGFDIADNDLPQGDGGGGCGCQRDSLELGTFEDRWPENHFQAFPADRRSDRGTKVATERYDYGWGTGSSDNNLYDWGSGSSDNNPATFNSSWDSGYSDSPVTTTKTGPIGPKTSPKKRSGTVVDGYITAGSIAEGYLKHGSVTDGYDSFYTDSNLVLLGPTKS
jgi:hypothetical protein